MHKGVMYRAMEEAPGIAQREVVALAMERAAALVIRHLDRQRISLTAMLTLGRLYLEGPVRLTALATAEGVSQPAMTQVVQRLERDGLVARLDDPEDGRATLVGITGAGRGHLDELRAARHDRIAVLLATLPADDELTLADAMRTALPILERLRETAARQATSTDPNAGPT